MPDARRRNCKVCGRPDTVVGPISWSGLCAEHGRERLEENIDGIHARCGPVWERRRYGIALREFGPRIALALKQAGVFDPEPVDTRSPSP